MTQAELLQIIQSGCSELLGQPNFIVSAQRKQVLAAMQSYWTADDGTQLDKVLALMPQTETNQ